MKRFLVALSCLLCCYTTMSAYAADKEITGLTIDHGRGFEKDKNDKSNNGKHIGNNDVAPVPEPATIFLVGSALVGAAAIMRKNNKKK